MRKLNKMNCLSTLPLTEHLAHVSQITKYNSLQNV